MTVRGERLGVITLSTAESGRILGPEQLSVLEELGRRAAVAVDRRALHRQRSAIARTLQNSLLPPALPEIAGVETAALYRAAGEGNDVGGDFYDLFTRRRGRVDRRDRRRLRQGRRGGGGDRAGALHDPHRRGPAALAGVDPRLAQRRHVPPGPGRTLLHDRLRAPRSVASDDPRGRLVRWASPGAARRAGGEVEELGPPGTLLGLVRDPQLEDEHAELRAGRRARALHRRHHRGARPGARDQPGGPARGPERDAGGVLPADRRAAHRAGDGQGGDAAARRHRRAGAARAG